MIVKTVFIYIKFDKRKIKTELFFSLTKRQKLNTKVGLHTDPPPPQTFRALPDDLGN